jgi:hypothetical protein
LNARITAAFISTSFAGLDLPRDCTSGIKQGVESTEFAREGVWAPQGMTGDKEALSGLSGDSCAFPPRA